MEQSTERSTPQVAYEALGAQAASQVAIPCTASSWKVMSATVVKSLQLTRRYLPNLIGLVVQMGVRVLFFLMLSGFVTYDGKNHLEGHQLFTFLMAGMLLMVFNNTALYAPLNAVTQDLMNGTLEYLYTNPIARYPYYIGTAIASALVDLVAFVPLFLYLVWYANTDFVNSLSILAVCILVLITLMAFGTMIALLGLLWRQVASVVGVVGLLFEFLAGAYLPVSEFPSFVKYMAYALPYTWGYDLVRYYSLGSHWNTLVPYWMEWAIVGTSAAVFTTAAAILLRLVESRAKKQGLHLL